MCCCVTIDSNIRKLFENSTMDGGCQQCKRLSEIALHFKMLKFKSENFFEDKIMRINSSKLHDVTQYDVRKVFFSISKQK